MPTRGEPILKGKKRGQGWARTGNPMGMKRKMKRLQGYRFSRGFFVGRKGFFVCSTCLLSVAVMVFGGDLYYDSALALALDSMIPQGLFFETN